jgi:hypothetical protein
MRPTGPSQTTGESWPDLIREMSRLRLPAKYELEYDLDQLDIENRRVQCRDSNHVAPPETTARFAIQMAHSMFPPIIVTRDAWTVDGNTRVAAKRERGEHSYPAFIIDLDYKGASDQDARRLNILAATLNCRGGLVLSFEERRRAVEDMIAENWLADQIARAIGVTKSVVTQVKHEVSAQARLSAFGIVGSRQISIGALRALGTPEVLALNDAPYRALAALAIEAGLTPGEFR